MKLVKDNKSRNRFWHITPKGKYCIDKDDLSIHFYPAGETISTFSSLKVLEHSKEDVINEHFQKLTIDSKESKSTWFSKLKFKLKNATSS